MKSIRLSLPVLLLILLPPLGAQTTTTGPVSANPIEHAAPLDLKWNETYRLFSVPVSNTSSTTLKVLGVQCSAGLYVTDFPSTIPANGSANFSLLYMARPGLGGKADLLRVLTDAGTKVIEIDHGRATVAVLEQHSVQWTLGSAPTPQTVTLLLVPGTTAPTGVKALGGWLQASLQTVEPGKVYSITITPSSTEKLSQGVVMVKFSPSLPGVVTVISCSVVAGS